MVRRLAVLGLVAIVLAVYGRVVTHEFVTWDDPQHVLTNRLVNPPTWHGLAEAWRKPFWGLYVPVSYSFFAAETAASQRLFPGHEGPHPGVFHFAGVALHAGCVLMAFVVLRRLLRAGGRERVDLPAALGAAVFALHPVQVESVAWVSETRGLLCGLFSLVAIRLYLDAADEARGRVAYLLATMAYLLALLSKPAAVAVPLMVAALDVGLLQRPWRKTLAAIGPWMLLAAVFALVTKAEQPGGLVPPAPPVWARPLVAADAVQFYLAKLAVPIGLGPDYARSPEWVMEQGWFWFAWIVPALVLAVLAVSRDRRWLLTAAALSAAWLAPVLGFVPFDFQRVSTVADRYLYLAMLGPALALAWWLSVEQAPRLPPVEQASRLLTHKRGRLCYGATLLAIAALAWVSFVQAGYWRDSETLVTRAAEVQPRSVVAAFHAALLLEEQGRQAEAIEAYRAGLTGHPEIAEFYAALGELLRKADRTDEAIAVLEQCLERYPRWAEAHFVLASLLVDRGRMDAALQHYGRALELQPDYASAHLNLGALLESLGEIEAARLQYLAARRLAPHDASAHFNLGNLARKTPGGRDEAVLDYEQALRCDHQHVGAHVNLGAVLLEQGKTREAIGHARAALEISPEFAPARGLLETAEAAERKK